MGSIPLLQFPDLRLRGWRLYERLGTDDTVPKIVAAILEHYNLDTKARHLVSKL